MKWTVPTAVAVRVVCALADTLTMCAEPVDVRWGRAVGRGGFWVDGAAGGFSEGVRDWSAGGRVEVE